jgi:hypothetical protein
VGEVLEVIATRDTETALRTGPSPAARRTIAVVVAGAGYAVSNWWALAFAPEPFRWWANFIVLPGLVLLAFAVGLTRAAPETRFVLAWLGAVIVTTGLLLFGHAMGHLWPFMIVVPAAGPLGLFAMRPADPSVRAFIHTLAGLAAVAIALGVTFVLINTDAVDLGAHHWWGGFMLGAAAVPLVNGLIVLAQRRGTYWFSMAVLLVALGGYTALAGIAQLT